MLDTLRKNSKSALIYVFFGIIIVVFVFSFGPGSGGCRSGTHAGPGAVAATVNGTKIPLSDFEQSYGRIYREYQQRAGGAFTEELARTLKLRENVLDQLIDRELLTQAAQKQGITVGNRELAEAVHKIPAFQVDGHFDREQYRLIVERQLGTSPSAFEEELRRGMLAQKMAAALTASAKVSDDEVRAEFIREKDRLDLSYVRFSPQAFKAEVAKPAPEKVEEFLKANGERVAQNFKQNEFRYSKPKRVQARHILVKVDDKAGEAASEAAKKKIEDLRQKAAGGADFATLAKENSEDLGSKEKGGDLGIFGPGTMDPAFEKASFALKPGELSEPVKTRFGWHLIKVEQVMPEEKKELKDVEKEIAAELMIDDAAKQLAQKKAEEALAQAKAGKKLEELYPAAEKPAQPGMISFGSGKPETAATGPFTPTAEYLPGIGVSPELSKAAAALTEQAPVPEKAFEVNGSWYVVALKSRQKADLQELESKMAEYREKARERKGGEVLDAFVKSLKQGANIEKNEALVDVGGGEPVVGG